MVLCKISRGYSRTVKRARVAFKTSQSEAEPEIKGGKFVVITEFQYSYA